MSKKATAAKTVPPLGAIASVVIWIVTSAGAPAHLPAQIAAAVFALLTGVVHSGTAKKAVKKVSSKVRSTKPKRVQKRRKRHHVIPEFTKVFDSVNVAALHGIVSTTKEGVAGYDSGAFNNIREMEQAYPDDYHASIATNAGTPANWLDVERFDATPEQFPGWFKKWRKHGARGAYISLSALPALRAAARAAGLADTDYEVWVADWVGFLFIPPGVGIAGCQCISNNARDYDESLVHTARFFGLREAA